MSEPFSYMDREELAAYAAELEAWQKEARELLQMASPDYETDLGQDWFERRDKLLKEAEDE